MSPYHRSLSIAAAIAAVMLLPGKAGAADSRELPITLDAASSDVDYRSSTVRFRDVKISQGTVSVRADQADATGLDFAESTWQFKGNVRIVVDGGNLASDEATVEFRDNVVSVAAIRGSPAEFEQRLADNAGTARGRAGAIRYEITSGKVTFSKDAWLTDGRNEIRGEQLVYNVKEQRVQAQALPGSGQDRVRITIRPGEKAAPPPPAEGDP